MPPEAEGEPPNENVISGQITFPVPASATNCPFVVWISISENNMVPNCLIVKTLIIQ